MGDSGRGVTLAPGRVITGSWLHSTPPGDCIICGMDAEGGTLTTWTFVGPTSTYSQCYWCQELWGVQGWLDSFDEIGG